MRAKKRISMGISLSISLSINQRTTNREQRIILLLMNNRKEWLKTDAGKLYKQRTNKNYRQKKQQTKKDNLKVNKSFEFHFPCGITLKE
jgi:hypothetical protein